MNQSMGVCALLVASAAYPVLAGERFTPPKTASPMMYLVRSIDKNEGTITVVTMLPMAEFDKDSRLKVKLKPFEHTWDVNNYRFQTAAGKRIEGNKVWDAVKVGQALVMTADHNSLDLRYRQLLAPDTIILIVRPPEVAPALGGDGGKQKAQTFDELHKELKKQGWHLTNPPAHFPDREVLATLEGGKRDRLMKKGFLRHSWVVSLPPIPVTPGSPIYLRESRGQFTARFFERPDGETFRVLISSEPIKVTRSGKEMATTTIEYTGKSDKPRQYVWLQQVAELVDGERVLARWYLNSTSILDFIKDAPAKDAGKKTGN